MTLKGIRRQRAEKIVQAAARRLPLDVIAGMGNSASARRLGTASRSGLRNEGCACVVPSLTLVGGCCFRHPHNIGSSP